MYYIQITEVDTSGAIYPTKCSCGEEAEVMLFFQGQVIPLCADCILRVSNDLVKNKNAFSNAEIGVFTEEEVHHNCTVEIWSNPNTDEVSIGWYRQ